MPASLPHHLRRTFCKWFSLLVLSICLMTPADAKRSSGHLLGPTGMMGADKAREIKVTKVEKQSPADGIVKAGDVIVGAGGSPFAGNPRHEMAAAINRAEANNGALALTLKDGSVVELKLNAFGSFSESAPYQCPKTDALVSAIAKQMVDSGDYQDRLAIGWLGLMATGDKALLERVKAELPKQEWANPDRESLMAIVNGESDGGLVSWYWGYQLLALSEYHLLTGDKSVLPGIETYALALSLGQDAAGTWGHRMASPNRDGRLPGYSHINQPSLACFIGLILAQKCGLDRPELDTAILKCQNFFNTFTGKGTIPYGVHDPNTRSYNNNGMSAMTAIAMALLKDDEAATFFSQQTAAAHHDLESGHATYFFNVMWSPLGASVGGPEIAREYSERTRWLYTLYRSWDHKFTYDGSGQKSMNCSGALLLNYCLPRKQLFITGKQASPAYWVKGPKVEEVMNSSQIDFKKLSADEMIQLFGHPAPQVRRGVSWFIREKEGDFHQRLDQLILEGNDNQQMTALGAYGYKCPPEWITKQRLELIGERLKNSSENPDVRAQAASALSWHQPQSQVYFNDILRFLIEEKDDDFGLIDKSLGSSLNTMTKNPFGDGLVTDKDLFYAAVNRLSQNLRQEGRGHAMQLLRHMPAEDFHRVADTVKHVTLNRDASYHSYHNPQNTLLPGGQLLARLGIKEGMDWAIATIDTKDGKNSFKNKAIVGVLDAYGAYAKPYAEKIQQDEKLHASLSGGKSRREWDSMMKKIKTDSKPAEQLMSFEEAAKANPR